MDPTIKKLVDAPLGDALKLYVHGKPRTIKRGRRPQYHDEIDGDRLSRTQVEERRVEAKSKKVNELWDYYATTQVPFERVAEHTGYDLEIIKRAMA